MKTDQSILLDEPKEVDVVAIERELSLLWKDATDSAGGSASAPEVRACSLNFIVVTGDLFEAEAIGDLVGEVTVEHPSRIFLVAAERSSATSSMEAWISARCSLPVPGGKQVCCEQITIVGRGTDAQKIPSIITSLLVPDVPVVLLWKATVDTSDTILRALVHICDRALIDSSEDLAPETALGAWETLIRQERDHATFGDLAWTHLIELRSLIAQTFQPLKIRQHLATLDTVTIIYSSTHKPQHSGLSQALLLTGWLALKLEWVLIHPLRQSGAGEYSAKFRLGDQAVTVSLVPTGSTPDSPGCIESVSIHSSAGLDLRLQTFADRGEIHVSTHVRNESQDRVALVKDQTEAQLTSRELEMLERDTLYEQSLTKFVQILAGKPE